jgi:hypothetical protein
MSYTTRFIPTSEMRIDNPLGHSDPGGAPNNDAVVRVSLSILMMEGQV